MTSDEKISSPSCFLRLYKGIVDFSSVELLLQFIPAWFDEYGAIWENDGRHAAVAVVDLYDELGGFMIPFKPDIEVGDVIGLEEFLGAVTVRAKPGRVHHDLRWIKIVVVGHLDTFMM